MKLDSIFNKRFVIIFTIVSVLQGLLFFVSLAISEGNIKNDPLGKFIEIILTCLNCFFTLPYLYFIENPTAFGYFISFVLNTVIVSLLLIFLIKMTKKSF